MYPLSLSPQTSVSERLTSCLSFVPLLQGLKLYESRGFEKVAELDLSEGVIHPALERQPQPLLSNFQLPLPLLISLSGRPTQPGRPREEVEIGLVEEKDWPSLFACDFAGMEGDVFGETIAPVHLRPDLETRISAFFPFPFSPTTLLSDGDGM